MNEILHEINSTSWSLEVCKAFSQLPRTVWNWFGNLDCFLDYHSDHSIIYSFVLRKCVVES